METIFTNTPAVAENATEAINEVVETLANDPVTFWGQMKVLFENNWPKLLMIAVLLVGGVFLIRLSMSFLKKMLERSKLDRALHVFTLSIIRITLYIFLGILLLIEISPQAATGLVAAMGIFGLAVSLAVKDSLANLAGGLSVLFTRPFSPGDYVSIGETEGKVMEIRLNYTVLTTIDNKLIHIPNGDVAKAEIINYTSMENRRLDLEFAISYNDDFKLAKKVICDVLQRHPMALQEPEPVVRMTRHADSAVIICCRVWVKTESYWPLHYDLMEEVFEAFQEIGISIPFQQLEVHMHGTSDATR